MSCERCKSGVYETIGELSISPRGRLKIKYGLVYTVSEKNVSIQMCSLCENVRLEGNKLMKDKLSKEIRNFIFKDCKVSSFSELKGMIREQLFFNKKKSLV